MRNYLKTEKDKIYLNTVSVHLDYRFITVKITKEINHLSAKSLIYTCNNPDEIATLWDAGLSGVITDDPLKFVYVFILIYFLLLVCFSKP